MFAIIPFSILIFFFNYSIAKAQVLINEFSTGSSSDWVELYNIATVSADLSTYKLMDSGTNDKTLSGSISPGGFISFNFSNWLNNSTADGVRLYNGDILVDSIFYGSENQVCFASDTGSIGRYPDGGNTIDRFLTSTRDVSNNQANIYPCPSPTPSVNPTIAATAVPTTTSSPTPPSSPTPVLKTYTPRPTAKSTPQILGEEIIQSPGVNILGITDNDATPSASNSNKNFPFYAIIFIVMGLILIGVSFFLAYKKKYTSLPNSLI